MTKDALYHDSYQLVEVQKCQAAVALTLFPKCAAELPRKKQPLPGKGKLVFRMAHCQSGTNTQDILDGEPYSTLEVPAFPVGRGALHTCDTILSLCNLLLFAEDIGMLT